MLPSIEVLMPAKLSVLGTLMLSALRASALARGHVVRTTETFAGRSNWLMLWGVGAPDRVIARRRQLELGGRAILIDMGYFGRDKTSGYARISIDTDHPQAWLDQTPANPQRWRQQRIDLRNDADPDGPIILVGLGRKSRSYLNAPSWERNRLMSLRQRFPGRAVIHRPKPPGTGAAVLDCVVDRTMPIAELLRGASLVSCRHSNVAVDAIVAGVPFECDDGAARWLQGKPFTVANRLDFLQRLCWWQWKSTESDEMLEFLTRMIAARDGL